MLDGLAILPPVVFKARSVRILVTGATGLVGRSLVRFLRDCGHSPGTLVRRPPKSAEEVEWHPEDGELDARELAGAQAVVHLAGENIAAGRWTKERKRRILESRTKGTDLLCRSLAKLTPQPSVLVSASAIGFYGNRGDEMMTERSARGSGFLAEVASAWEAATRPASDANLRVVTIRLGVVLAAGGGALAKMLTPFRLGLGGVVGNGCQFMSWVTLEDVVRAIDHCISNDSLAGPVNVVAPEPVTNREFTKTLGNVLGRPTLLPLPSVAARMAFGEMADELLLASTRVAPERLLQSGFEFRYPDLETALRAVLGR